MQSDQIVREEIVENEQQRGQRTGANKEDEDLYVSLAAITIYRDL